jgi:hypothetical protein
MCSLIHLSASMSVKNLYTARFETPNSLNTRLAMHKTPPHQNLAKAFEIARKTAVTALQNKDICAQLPRFKIRIFVHTRNAA